MVDILKALNEATTTAGGYLVPEEFATKMYELVQQNSVMLPIFPSINMKYDKMYLPTETTGSTAYWVEENATITAGDQAFGRVTLDAQKVAAITELSSELMEDSNPDVADYIARSMARDLALEVDDQILNGDATYFSGLRDTTTNTDTNLVTASTHGDAITAAKIFNAQKELLLDNWGVGEYLAIHPRTFGVLRSLTDTNSRPLFDTTTFGSPLMKDGVLGTILGLKVITHSKLPITLTQGTSTECTDAIVFCKQSAIVGKRRELRLNKFYSIDKDNWKLQSNMRLAFSVVYPKSICIIQDLTS